jgi:ATP-dependent RNA helicase RhlE
MRLATTNPDARVHLRRVEFARLRMKDEIEVTDNTQELSGFAALGLNGIVMKALDAAGFETPTPIQAKAIPPQLKGRDILGVAQTGSGKTAAFVLPILRDIIAMGDKRQHNTARALIMVPTRELAVQIDECIRMFARGAHISTALVLGGMSRFQQIKKMLPGVDFLIATPGRLLDLMNEGAIKLHETKFLVLDEADRMLDMGFIKDVRKIAQKVNPARRTALFSATMPAEIEDLAASLMKDPVRIEIARPGTSVTTIEQQLIYLARGEKRACLSALLKGSEFERVIVFARTKHGADAVQRHLERDGFSNAAIHGNKSQNARQKALNDFKAGKIKILVATDIAARGIDVTGISHVINFDLPDEAESYVHRIGRTARNGASGVSITLCEPDENNKLRAVERLTRLKLTVIEKPEFVVKPKAMGEPRTEAEPASMPHRFRTRGQERSSGRPQGEKRSGDAPRNDGRPSGAPKRHKPKFNAERKPGAAHPAFAPNTANGAPKKDGPAKRKRRFRPSRAKAA